MDMSPQAIEAWRANIRADTQAGYHLSMAVAILHAEGAERALPWAEAARGFPARMAAGAYVSGLIFNALDRPDEAGRIHQEALRRDADYETAALLDLADIYMNTAVVPEKARREALDRAIAAAMARGDAALACLLRGRLAHHLVERDDLSGAAELIRAMPETPEGTDEEARLEIAGVLARLGHLVLAKQDRGFAALVLRAYTATVMTDHLDVPFLLGLMSGLLTHPADDLATRAEQDFRGLIARIPHSGPSVQDLLCHTAGTAFSVGASAFGVFLMKTLLAANPHLEQPRMRLAHEYFLTDQEKGLDVVRRGLADNPGSMPLIIHLTPRLVANGRPEEAGRWAERVLASDPDSAVAVIVATTVACARNQAAGVIASLKERVVMTPIQPLFAYSFAAALLHAGRAGESLMWLDKIPVTAKISPLHQLLAGCALQRERRGAESAASYADAIRNKSPAALVFSAQCWPVLQEEMLAGLRAAGARI